MNVEQIDLFAAIEEIEKAQHQKEQSRAVIRKVEASGKEIEKLGTEDMIPPSAPIDWLYVLTWPWNFFTSLFGLGVWVNVYMVSRKYGGCEDGGWYYLHYDCVFTKAVGFWEAEAQQRELELQYRISHKWGDLYSRRGFQDVVVCIEKRRAAGRTQSKPNRNSEDLQTIPYALVR
ncbi:hypothetical protein [Paenibacillus sp. MMO-177]|uniref:hypothetical protein n=1 Tax=Paenibacillus sp. MMO-177 TaxID=3081289 RepID=UPI003017F1CE